MDDYERSKVADCLKTIKFKAGDYIIRQVSRKMPLDNSLKPK